MNLEKMLELLNSDLSNEYMHWHFYMHAAMNIQGLHRQEVQELLLTEATGEMKHVEEFGRLIVGLGGTPTTAVTPFPNDLVTSRDILEEALRFEDEVVSNYALRIDQAQELQGVADQKANGKYIELFLEEQILASRADADHLREMVKSCCHATDKI